MTGNAWDRTSRSCVKTDDTPAQEAHLIMNWEYVRDHEQEPWKANKQV
eukprot:CAMPEP_0180346096 /NCGR_PEP_ID=MMETSP0989-20121125/3682_1 /TAXON_ID=697907 /ORGANISM="non described non described, Strain CCMP2293" /LENGTH=47 /DNA_ID= /DNA_START= /DNA_END= /DNA_ORIENTATION=